MPPKKKKTAAKNVNRGFATTSIPKKVVASEPAPEEPAAPAPGDPKASTSESTTNGSSTPATAVGDAKASEGQEEWDAEQQEERELQALAERIRPACEKEIAKQMKVRLNMDFYYHLDAYRWRRSSTSRIDYRRRSRSLHGTINAL